MLSFTFQYGSLWRRFIAIIIDLAIVAIIGGFLFDPVAIVLGHDALKQANVHAPFSVVIVRDYSIWAIATVIVAWLYFAIMESSSGQATFGKRMMGLLVVNRDEGRLSFGKASIRFWIKALSIFTAFVGYFIAFFDSKSRMMHDRVAGSLVLEAQPEVFE